MQEPPAPRTEAVGAPAPAFELRVGDPLRSPFVFSSPHSGRLYPEAMMNASVLGATAIRRSEDAFVDELLDGVEHEGATVFLARYARAYVDVNREPYELDPAMFEDELPSFARAATPRVAAGLGAIAKVVAEGQEIYGRKLRFAEARERIEAVHRPYHSALAATLADRRARFGRSALIDWHSMPSIAAKPSRRGRAPDIVLGDRFGAACAPRLTDRIARELGAMGYVVARNAPYAGGYISTRYGRPAEKGHAVQIEINRGLYLDEARMEPTAGFTRLREDVSKLCAVLAADWRDLI